MQDFRKLIPGSIFIVETDVGLGITEWNFYTYIKKGKVPSLDTITLIC